MFRSCPVSLAPVGLIVWVTGCSSYKQIQIGDVADHSKVRVTLTGGERFRLYDPIVGRAVSRDMRNLRASDTPATGS